jgi:GTPase Era involved in 16S rRNA processing
LVTFLDEKSKFKSKGFDYSVVAILGPQSSGKSTLLNLLFGTKFDEMDALSGRQQTTQGVWMGVSGVDGHVILVMDVEGTDGRERGEADVFERRTSLFSLTVTSVLIINMWMNDIGRFQAANMGLLKTIFEMNLQLIKENQQELRSSKTLLLFIIRDYINTPVDKLKTTLLSDLDKLWQGITKLDVFTESAVTDFF